MQHKCIIESVVGCLRAYVQKTANRDMKHFLYINIYCLWTCSLCLALVTLLDLLHVTVAGWKC